MHYGLSGAFAPDAQVPKTDFVRLFQPRPEANKRAP
jgi:hypothetical protein